MRIIKSMSKLFVFLCCSILVVKVFIAAVLFLIYNVADASSLGIIGNLRGKNSKSKDGLEIIGGADGSTVLCTSPGFLSEAVRAGITLFYVDIMLNVYMFIKSLNNRRV